MPRFYVKKFYSEKKKSIYYFLVSEGYGAEKRHLLNTAEACEYLNLRPAELQDLDNGDYVLADYKAVK